MSEEKSGNESKRWLLTAIDDLDTAKILLENNRYPASCFHSQQTGEKALKAVIYRFNGDPWGHSLVRLLEEVRSIDKHTARFSTLKKEAMALDRFYIPTRYPDGLPGITPSEAYNQDDAKLAFAFAKKFIVAAKEAIEA
jgi:HEPN domain-containing protein